MRKSLGGFYYKKAVFLGWVLLFLASLNGCISPKHVFRPAANVIFPSYSGLKACITVTGFEIKASKANSDIGSGVRQMLVSALLDSNRFIIPNVETKNTERRSQRAKVGDKERPADLIINVAITEFEPQASGGSSGIGGGGGVRSGVLGAMLGDSLGKTCISLDVRIIDAHTHNLLAAKQVRGQASNTSETMMKIYAGKWPLSAELVGYVDKSMESAIRRCLIDAIRYIVESVPASYYKY
ncbi:MAG: hypothetical protein NC923_06620 [Candidatus Omnitrophica bacterium]|nr:hypothetical protein [Candidatus Omnitrophota bacterium]